MNTLEMSTRHTKGPWKNNEGSIETADGVVVAYVTQAADLTHLTDAEYTRAEAECAANTALVQAAPALFAHLRYALWCFDQGEAPALDALANMRTALVLALKGGGA